MFVHKRLLDDFRYVSAWQRQGFILSLITYSKGMILYISLSQALCFSLGCYRSFRQGRDILRDAIVYSSSNLDSRLEFHQIRIHL